LPPPAPRIAPPAGKEREKELEIDEEEEELEMREREVTCGGGWI
jgi:hypothetical protein